MFANPTQSQSGLSSNSSSLSNALAGLQLPQAPLSSGLGAAAGQYLSQLSPKEMIGMAASVGGAILGAGAGSQFAVAASTQALSSLGVPSSIIGHVNSYASVFGAAGGAAAGAMLAKDVSNQICDACGIS